MMIDYPIFIFIICGVLYFFISAFVVSDMKKEFPDYYKRFGGMNNINPIKQVDLFVFLILRKYLDGCDNKFHKYDVFVFNLIIWLLSFILLMVTG